MQRFFHPTQFELKSVKVLILIVLAFFTINAQAQTLTLDELIKFQNSDFVTVNDILTSKGWDFSHSKKGDLNNYNTVTWAYEKNSFNEAKGWLTLYTDENDENIVSYQMHESKIYNSIKAKITGYKMKPLSNAIGDNEISSVYQGERHTVNVTINSDENKSNPNYLIAIISNKTYALIKINDILENIDQGKKEDELQENAVYNGSFIYKSKTLSFAQIFKDIELTQRIYMIPLDHYVYVISELNDNKVRVFCNGKFGYMSKLMLSR